MLLHNERGLHHLWIVFKVHRADTTILDFLESEKEVNNPLIFLFRRKFTLGGRVNICLERGYFTEHAGNFKQYF